MQVSFIRLTEFEVRIRVVMIRWSETIRNPSFDWVPMTNRKQTGGDSEKGDWWFILRSKQIPIAFGGLDRLIDHF